MFLLRRHATDRSHIDALLPRQPHPFRLDVTGAHWNPTVPIFELRLFHHRLRRHRPNKWPDKCNRNRNQRRVPVEIFRKGQGRWERLKMNKNESTPLLIFSIQHFPSSIPRRALLLSYPSSRLMSSKRSTSRLAIS